MSLTTNRVGVKVWQAAYLPFGGGHARSGDVIDLRFPGQWFQAESGLHQNWMRGFGPTIGGFGRANKAIVMPIWWR